MILYVNGSDHTAAVEAVNQYAFAKDDYHHRQLKCAPHPDNLKVSYGVVLANLLKMMFYTDAEAASSNARIIRSTKEWIESKEGIVPTSDMFMIIQWDGHSLSIIDSLAAIKAFHLYLNKMGIKHLFFNGRDNFLEIPVEERYDFGVNYINPYLPEEAFDGWLQLNGYSTVPTSNEHYGAEAHAAWARRLAKHIKDNNLI